MTIVFKDLLESIGTHENYLQQFANDVKKGFGCTPKTLHEKYLYDDRGSQLFRKIMELKEYYPTKCELQLVESNKQAILNLVGEEFNLVDLGAGDGIKTMILLEEGVSMKKHITYVPIDFSNGSNEVLGKALKKKLPNVDATIITSTYEGGLQYVGEHFKAQTLLCLFGPSIGNYDQNGAIALLKEMRAVLKAQDMLLITFDLRKDYKMIEVAYDDPQGVSREFEMNVLRRINSQLQGDIDVRKFFFHSYFDAVKGCIRNFLVSKESQDITIGLTGEKYHFDEYESVLVEESYKYTQKDIENLAEKAGFQIVQSLHDSKKYIVGSIWKKKEE